MSKLVVTMRTTGILLIAAALLSGACHSPSASAPESAQPSPPENAPSQSQIQISDDSLIPDHLGPGMKAAWKRFTKDGRYRLARVADMAFTEDAKRRINQSFRMWQGDVTFSDELVALVVDTTRQDANRFGVVLFRRDKPWSQSAAYTPGWLFRDRDLSQTAIDRVSGYLFVHTFTNAADYKTCRVNWDGSARRYICR